MLMVRLVCSGSGYHADAEHGEEQEPGQVRAAPVLQRSPFSLCPLKHKHGHSESLQNRTEPGRTGLIVPPPPPSPPPRPLSPARFYLRSEPPAPVGPAVYRRSGSVNDAGDNWIIGWV